jgi:hypothetical protein
MMERRARGPRVTERRHARGGRAGAGCFVQWSCSRAPRWCARVLGLSCGLAALSLARSATAAAGQWQAGGRLGVAWLSEARVGPSTELFLRRGLTDSLELDVQMLGSLHPFQADSKTRAAVSSGVSSPATPWAFAVAPGISYRWDVFRVVPYAGIGIGFYSGHSPSWNSAVSNSVGGQFGGSGRLGLDYLLNRSVVLSVQASAHVVNAESFVRVPWVQFGLGAAHAWGW